MANPSIEELKNEEKFELIAELHHSQIKDFVISRLSENIPLIRGYMYYQILMVVLGIFILTRGIVFAIRGSADILLFGIGALLFSLTILVPVHELLHGLAIKFTGARKVNYGAYFRKFIFYAEADRHVMNRQQFAFVALTPLFVIKFVTMVGCVILWNSNWLYFFAMIMALHSLFCAGDIGLMSVFYQDQQSEIFTYDVKEEKKSYYYQRRRSKKDKKKGSFYKLPQSHENN